MQKIKLVLITTMTVIFILAGVLIYFLANNLSQSKSLISQVVSKNLNLKTEFDSIHIDWLKLLEFKPSVSISNLSIFNPSSYHNSKFIEADNFRIELSLLKLLQKRIHINNIFIDRAIISLELNQRGMTNLDFVLKELSKKPAPISFKAKTNSTHEQSSSLFTVDTIELDEFTIKNSKLALYNYSKGSKPEIFKLDHINFDTQNFSTNKASPFNLELSIFDIAFPVLKYQGNLGPVLAESIPTKGKLELNFKLKDIPKESRRKYFGNLIPEPGSDDELRIEAQIAGDLSKQIQGEGFLSLKDIYSGKNKRHQLKLNGLIPIKLSFINLVTNPKLRFKSEKTKLQVNEDSFIELSTDINSNSHKTSIDTFGSIKGVEINEFLSAYTEYEDKLYGKFAIPEFSFKLDGSDADEMLTSMDGIGSIRISNGNLAILEKIYKLKGLLANYAEAKTNAKDEKLSKFTSIESNFRIENRKLKNDSIKIASSALTFYGSGEYSFDHKLNYHLLTKVLQREVPILISGTADRPKLSLDTKQFTINEVQRQLQPLADKFFKQFKALDKKELAQ